jgi:hypothetical protein
VGQPIEPFSSFPREESERVSLIFFDFDYDFDFDFSTCVNITLTTLTYFVINYFDHVCSSSTPHFLADVNLVYETLLYSIHSPH